MEEEDEELARAIALSMETRPPQASMSLEQQASSSISTDHQLEARLPHQQVGLHGKLLFCLIDWVG